MKYYYENILGKWVIDENAIYPYKQTKKGKLKDLPKDKLNLALEYFKDKKYFKLFKEKNLAITKKAIKDSVNEDQLIIQTISAISELNKVHNLLSKRLREWYSLYYPELSHKITDHQKFVEMSLKEKKEKDSMGANLSALDLQQIERLAEELTKISSLRDNYEKYLEKVMKKYCPNITALAGVTIAAKLIELAKGLKRLALFPASTLQLLGAEKALFRHLKTKAKSPKYGVLYEHQVVQNAPSAKRGKAARMLADKLSLCARIDFFKGEFKADEYKKELEGKLK